jgi:hypothetical protein
MEKCEVLDVEYVKSDVVKLQGKRDVINPYLKKGYHLSDESNGNYRLEKSAEVNVTIKNDSGSCTSNIKNEVVDHYKRQKITEKLANDFKQDIKNGKVGIYKDDNGELVIKNN